MKLNHFILSIVFLTINLVVSAQAFDYAGLWTKIENLESQGLPSSARQVTDSIYQNATHTNNYPQFVKAFIYRMKYRNIIENTDFSRNMMDAERLLDSVPMAVQPILHSMVAEMYWWYFENNRYKFYNRSKIAQFVPMDIATWDLSMIVNKVIFHYRRSLNDTSKLMQVPMSDFKEIITVQNYNSSPIHPSLYDFLALRAVDFFKNQESGLTRPGDEFAIDNELFFMPADSFARLHIDTTDTLSFKYIAISLFRDLIAAHLHDTVPENLIDIDLKRLAFVNTNSSNEDKDSLYLHSLNYLENKSKGTDISGIIGLLIAEKLVSMGAAYDVQKSENHRWDKKRAEDKCIEIKHNQPGLTDACNAILRNIKYKDITITIEHENIPNEPFRALVSFMNTDTLFVRVIPTSVLLYKSIREEYEIKNKDGSINWNQYQVDYFKKQKTRCNFDVVLPNSHDYQKHHAEIKIPALEAGYYFIMAGSDSTFRRNDHAVAFGLTAVTDISYINRTNSDGSNGFYVLNRKTGEPLDGVKLECWRSQYEYNSRKNKDVLFATLSTGHDGSCIVKHSDNANFWVDFTFKNQFYTSRNTEDLYSNGTFYSYDNTETNVRETNTFFFTDRSIYRPGQTIYFKGIVLVTDRNKYNQILPNYKSTVQLMDVNNQKVSELVLTTNEFGSLNGSFTAPKTGLNGNMTIENGSGSMSIAVEDYKRPTFEVKYDTLSSGYKLGEFVDVPGYAVAYSGAKLDGASIKYRVVRQTRFNGWYCWWRPQPVSPDKEITHGVTTSDKDGKFSIRFKAIPDVRVAVSTNPTFTYTVYADVTDVNGETHSAQKSVGIGYKALLLDAILPARLDRNDKNIFTFKALNMNGDNIPASGQIIIQKLKSTDQAYRDRKWAKPDVYVIPKEEYAKNFPIDQYADELDFSSWKTEKTVLESTFDTKKSHNFTLNNLEYWNVGVYVLLMKSKDQYGQEVDQKRYFTVYDKKGTSLPFPQTDWLEMVKDSGEPGDTVEILAGTAFDKTRVLFELETQDGIIQNDWTTLKHEQRLLKYPLKEAYRGNIALHYTFIRNNRLYAHTANITVPYTNKMLQLSFGTFRNKLQPGEKEQWQLTVKGKNGEKVAAEMVAALYDASLDVFKPHHFDFSLWPSFFSRYEWSAGRCFEPYSLRLLERSHPYYASFYQPNNYQFQWFNFGYRVYYNPINAQQYGSSSKSSFKILSATKQKGSDVSGKVTDKDTGEPLIGVNIAIAGTTSGVISDKDGNFNIHSDAADIILEFSFIGYTSQKVTLVKKGKVNLQVFLAPDIQTIDEVMVVGYGVQKKSMLTGSISRVQSPSMMKEKKSEVEADDAASKPSTPTPVLKADKQPDLSAVKARTNLNETAFFFPQLQTNENGEILINFTIPEALTRWKMLGFAHNKDLAYGFTENELVTQKTLMVTPNAPRFFREGDTLTFTSKITSLADNQLSGSAKLMLFDGLTMKPVDISLSNIQAQQSFAVHKQGSVNLNWNIIIPVGLQAVTYRVVAKAGDFSDGEESTLPVLTNSMLVTETLPLPIRGHQTKTFTLDKLVNNTSTTLRNHKLTLEFTSNPAWYAIQALPYLMEYPYECAEQTFSRFYANSIASSIVNSSPRIKQVFDSWKNSGSEALLSNLEKNQELKGLLLEETPWVMNAQNESERKKRVALLFDLNKMSDELGRALTKLQKTQVSNGGWPWFAGMPDDRYITQHIVCGMGKLDHLGIKNIHDDSKTWAMVSNAIRYTDQRISEDYRELKKLAAAGKLNMEQNHTGYTQIQYLYARSFFNDVPLENETKTALKYFLNQARTFWLSQNFYMQGMIAVAANRLNVADKLPLHIIRSFKEHAMHSDGMGMYWKQDQGWFWYQAPIETQALMIEAFDEVASDSISVNEMKVWLLKQKQTQDWKTTRATTEACYALLLRGSGWLENDEQVSITVGSKTIDPSQMPEVKVEAGTGYFKTSWNGSDITPDMGRVTITKKNDGVSWGALYWQYFEQLDKITAAETPLKMKKQLFVERVGVAGPVIVPITDTTHLHPGDLIKVRIELRVDRDMEYVHMKDMRASGLEPINVLSQYKYQDGLNYYESTRDAATNFFFGWLPKGTYVFEYPLRVTHYGNFSNGIGTIQSMYAPEFTSHSEGIRVIVKK